MVAAEDEPASVCVGGCCDTTGKVYKKGGTGTGKRATAHRMTVWRRPQTELQRTKQEALSQQTSVGTDQGTYELGATELRHRCREDGRVPDRRQGRTCAVKSAFRASN